MPNQDLKNYQNDLPASFLPSGPTLLVQSFNFYKTHFQKIVRILAVPLILFFVSFTLALFGDSVFSAFLFFTAIIYNIFSYFALFYFLTHSEEELSVKELYKKGRSFILPLIWINMLIGLAGMGGFFLLIIPGIILGLLTSQAFYILFSENIKGMPALIQSWHYSKGNLGKLFWRYLFFGLITGLMLIISGFITYSSNLLGTNDAMKQEYGFIDQFFQGIMSFVITPMQIIYDYLIFQYLRNLKPQPISDEEKERVKKKLKIFMIIGILGFITLFAILGIFIGGK